MERIQFNTGRHYTDQGQRIIGIKHNNVIYFHDIDRGIDGMFEAADDDFGPVELSKTIIMSWYDHNVYEWIPRDTPREILEELESWNNMDK